MLPDANLWASEQIKRVQVSDMNNLYFIHKDNRPPAVDEVELVENRCDRPGNGQPILRGLNYSGAKKRRERRDHPRFQLDKDTYALIRSISARPLKIEGKSMGCIACEVFKAKPAKLGIINNISKGGLTFQHMDSNIQISNEFVLDILLTDCRFYLPGIPFTLITDFVIPGDFPGEPIEMRQIRVQFQKLNASQKAKLSDFLHKHCSEIGEAGVKDNEWKGYSSDFY